MAETTAVATKGPTPGICCSRAQASSLLAITIFAGRYLFRLHPGILLGICAGSATSSPALAALLEKAESRVPVLGYSVSYAVGEVLFALWGSIIVLLVHKS
jgi:putative transport protein